MKMSRSSSAITLITIFLIAVLLSAAICMRLSEASSSHEAFAGHLRERHRLHHRRSHHHHHHYHHHHVKNSFSSRRPPPSWRLSFPRGGRLQPPPQPPPPPPPPVEEEMDPRYGVEKRLVPTGPNPLHN